MLFNKVAIVEYPVRSNPLHYCQVNTMNVKKQFADIIAVLEANPNKKVSSIMDEVLALCSKKSNGGSNGSTLYKDAEGKVVAVFCYYHKKWELVSKCEYGSKANTASGLNTMCKEGVSNWTKQQRVNKTAKAELLDKVAKGEVASDDIAAALEKIDEATKVVVDREDGHGFVTIDDLEALLN